MEDRTYVNLVVLTEHLEEVIKLLNHGVGEPDQCTTIMGDTSWIGYGDVNYGTIETLTQFAKKGIPYSVDWGAGDEYGPGEEHLRFKESGEHFFSSACKEWPLDTLFALLHDCKEYEHFTVKQFLELQISKHRSPTWDDQLEYSKRAKVLALITHK